MSVQSANSIGLISNPYQDAVVDFFQNGRGHGVIDAVAGSGKTTILLRLFNVIPRGKSVAYCVYNRANADEAKAKVGFRPGIYIKTSHGFGMGAWKLAYPDVIVDETIKWRRIAEHLDLMTDLTDERTGTTRRVHKHPQMSETIKKLIGFAKDMMFGQLVDMEDLEQWRAVINRHNLDQGFAVDGKLPIDIEAILTTCCIKAIEGLKHSIEIAPEIIDYGDMIYMPLMAKVRMMRYDYVFIDEAQDTNAARRELYKAMLKPNGRMIAVGDKYQAIYGFTGADNDSLDIIAEEMKATRLPLNINFRCSKEVIRAAQAYCPHIEAHEGAPEGSESFIKYAELFKMTLQPTDYIVCRNTAPLVVLAYELLRMGIACHIQGKDIGEGLINLTKAWTTPANVGQFIDKLTKWGEEQLAKHIRKGEDAKAMVLSDKVFTLCAIADGLPRSASLDDLRSKISNLFQDGDRRNSIKLLTIHKSKGLEAPRVFWLGRDQLQPSPFAKQEWQLEQESHLCLVAATRARVDLIHVDMPPKRKKEY